jgi:hypothetical protein
MGSHIPFVWFLILHVATIGVLTSASADAANVSLQLRLEESTILQDGVVVGEMVLTNEDSTMDFRPGRMFSVQAGIVKFEVEHPDGIVRIYTGMDAVTLLPRQQLHLGPGQFVQRPVCLMRYYDQQIFRDTGAYRVRCVYATSGGIVSDWVSLQVAAGGHGRERFVDDVAALNVLDAFRSDTAPIQFMAEHLDEYGNYTHEAAKLVIYNLGAYDVIPKLLSKRDGDGFAQRKAQWCLELARRHNIGVQIWEFILDRIEHPEKVNTPHGAMVYPANGYFF